MTEPEIPQKRPYPVQVEAGKEYHVCMCGKSQSQPMCDGSHAGSGLPPHPNPKRLYVDQACDHQGQP